MPATPEQRQRVVAMTQGFRTADEYIKMLEHLVPDHYDYTKTTEYKNWRKTRSLAFLVWCKWRNT